jgi:hypothetical protein
MTNLKRAQTFKILTSQKYLTASKKVPPSLQKIKLRSLDPEHSETTMLVIIFQVLPKESSVLITSVKSLK